ncbi:hypothetical protein BGZ61DRAFT_77890 [Ilyonectria robusta]|uniref:uncharacterized protein n=1 Tax=Ilyonectria robusta TaxID=1079257 RepID=UPI001E8CD778|nr:uncharacterized protein BGZ61DRAFT_77890 [Ilyonectria robusta]KAH8735380.1 hypothetical protein BGZ61DRAFT_77890 [Ilyonectria robusta]
MSSMAVYIPPSVAEGRTMGAYYFLQRHNSQSLPDPVGLLATELASKSFEVLLRSQDTSPSCLLYRLIALASANLLVLFIQLRLSHPAKSCPKPCHARKSGCCPCSCSMLVPFRIPSPESRRHLRPCSSAPRIIASSPPQSPWPDRNRAEQHILHHSLHFCLHPCRRLHQGPHPSSPLPATQYCCCSS